MTIYRFVGEGEGVPGLPHEISEEDAAAAGLTELLQAAIANGNYAPAGEGVSAETARPRSSKRTQGVAHE